MRLAAAVVLSLILVPALLFSFAACITTPFLFDAPGTETQVATYALALSVLSLPVTLIAALAAVWIAVPARRSAWWYAGLLLPVASVAAFIIAGYARPGFM